MPTLDSSQDAFADAVWNADLPLPDDVVACGGPDRRRLGFSAYRNNVFVGLVNLIAARFPATQRIAGEDFFRGAARVYAQANPPSAKLNIAYGSGFADFIETFAPAASVPYLADVARIEWACHEASVAPESERFEASALAQLSLEDAQAACFVPHPSLRLVPSRFAAVTIWRANAGDGPVGPIATDVAGDALIARPHHETRVHELPPGGAFFAARLADGSSLCEASEEALGRTPGLDLGVVLVTLLAAGGLSSFKSNPQMEDVS